MAATFSFVMSDVNGAGYMPQVAMYLGPSPSSPGCEVILYHDDGTPYANGAYLVADNGAWIGPVYPGGGNGGYASESNAVYPYIEILVRFVSPQSNVHTLDYAPPF